MPRERNASTIAFGSPAANARLLLPVAPTRLAAKLAHLPAPLARPAYQTDQVRAALAIPHPSLAPEAWADW